MLDFCPFDFEKIDMENLAYELVFLNGWSWERVKEDTIFGDPELEAYIVENDTVRSEEFLERKKVDVQHVILLEDKSGKKCGFQHVLELIEKKGGDLRYELENGQHIFKLRNKKIVRAMPCCPYCHSRLPIGWEYADDFIAISLMGRTSGGKTTLLYSLMDHNWTKLKNIVLPEPDGRRVFITAAHLHGDPKDSMYYALEKEAEEMCKKDGDCPHNSEKEIPLPPVFLKVVFEKHTMIVGIYDNSGENLETRSYGIYTDIMEKLLDKMFAEIFLFDPYDMNLKLSEKPMKVERESCQILEIEAQGELQKENQDMRKSADEVLFRGRRSREEKEKFRAFTVYENIKDARMQEELLEKMKTMYFVGVLSMCDLIENMPEVKAEEKYIELFSRGQVQHSGLDDNEIEGRSDLVRRLFINLELFGENTESKIAMFENDYKTGGVFWDCVSALGCDAELAGKIYGEYDPIRVADPLLTCIMKRMEDNEWL